MAYSELVKNFNRIRDAMWDINVRYSPFTSEWNIEGKSVDRNNDLANLTYGTSRVT